MVSASYAQRVGEQLRAVRKRKRLSLQAVEASSQQEFKASVLGAYERGERAISVPRLQRLATFYDVAVDHLLPAAGGPTWNRGSVIDLRGNAVESAQGADENEDRVTIDLERLENLDGNERELVMRYIGMIQTQRQDFNGRMLTIRIEDIRALAILFDTTTDLLRRRLDDLGLCLHA